MKPAPKILVTRKLPDNVEARLLRDYEPKLNPHDKFYSPDELVSLSRDCAAILCCHTEKFNAEVIAALSENVKIIANFSVGTDHVDLAAAREKGVIVTNTPDVLSDATAEIAVLLMLAAARRANEGFRMVREREWKDWSPSFMVGKQLTGKRIGILGMGRVGQVMATRARGMGMEVHYHNRRRLDLASECGATFHANVNDLLRHSDVLSIHCPNTPDTQGMLDAEKINLLPDDAIVVNTARGAIVNDDALIAALKSKKLWAAGLDVFNGEPQNIHPGYRELDNVFLLPHVGSATFETRDAMGYRALDNLDAVFTEQEPGDRVA